MEESDGLRKLERLKLREELKQLKKQNKQSWIKLVLSVLGVGFVLVGLLLKQSIR